MIFRYFFFLIVVLVFSSCDFNFSNEPGPQVSVSAEAAKSHGTYIASYIIKNSNINGVGIKCIFAEKQYWRETGLFLKKEVDCCKAQLVIVSNIDGPFKVGATGYGKDWTVIGFESKYTLRLYKKYSTLLLPDTIPLTVVSIKGKDSSKIIQKLTLYKVK